MEFDLLESRVRVESNDREFLDGLSACYDVELDHHGEDRRVSLAVRVHGAVHEERVRALHTDPPEALADRPVSNPSDLCSLLNDWAVRSARSHHVFHAGAVAWNGVAILLPGASYSGKTTLTASLVQRGFELVSDEVGAISIYNSRLAVFPRKPAIRPGGLSALGLGEEAGMGWPPDPTRYVGVEALQGKWARGRPELGLIVLPRFEAEGGTQMRPVTLGEAVVTLSACSCSLATHKESGLDWIIGLARRVDCYELVHSDPKAAFDLIAARLQQHE